jgi:hypothetical protein
VRSGPGEARTILLLHIISVRPSKQPLMVRTFLKVYMELGSSFLFLQEQIKDIIIILCNRQALPVVLDVLGGLGIVPERIIRVAEGVLDKQSIARHRGPHGDCHRRGRALLLCHTPPVCSIVKQLQSLQHSLLVSRRCRCRAGASARSGPRTRPCARPEMATPMREGVWDWLLVVLNAVSVHT